MVKKGVDNLEAYELLVLGSFHIGSLSLYPRVLTQIVRDYQGC